MNIELARI